MKLLNVNPRKDLGADKKQQCFKNKQKKTSKQITNNFRCTAGKADPVKDKTLDLGGKPSYTMG